MRGILITYEELDIREDGTIWYDGKEKNYYKSGNGYYQIGFSHKCHSIHRLIAKKFIPNPENKPQVNHINGIKTDNRVSNLEWCTSSENITHSYKTGLSSNHSIRKLTMKEVREIRSKYVPRKYSHQRLADEYGVSSKTIGNIIKNITYKEKH